jgi:lipopolysaccharide export system permease protein
MMPLTTIWERYFLREMSKVFVLFLFGFYGLYALIDYSNHSGSFQNYRFTFWNILTFYGYEFVTRMDVLVPFAILIACIKTLCTLNTNNELVAFMASGIKLKRLLLPFIAFGLFFTFAIYFNTEVLQPRALKFHKHLDHTRAKEKQKKNHHPHIQQLPLEDGSSIVFQNYEDVAERFFDAYWIRSIDDIYRIRYLYPHRDVPSGSFVEHLQRDDRGDLTITETFTEILFPAMLINAKTLVESVTSPEALSLSALHEKLSGQSELFSEKEARLLTTYYYKLAMPWLCLLAIIAPIPFCTRFSRTLPVFFIYALSIFGLVAFYLVMDAGVVLGERQSISPALAIWVPFSAFFAFFGYRFARL